VQRAGPLFHPARPMIRRSPPTRPLTSAAAVCLLAVTAGESTSSPVAAHEVRVRASETFALCLVPALEAFGRQTGVRATLEVRDPDPAEGADVVVGEDSELTRVLEGGHADPRAALDIGTMPWVFVSPAGSPADVTVAVRAGERLVILGGPLGRLAREALNKRLPAQQIHVSRDPAELRGARYALVPRSLAGPGEQRPADVPPLVAVAAAVTGSKNLAGARALLDFLRSPPGRAALLPCLTPPAKVGAVDTKGAGAALAGNAFAASVVEWWLPQCTLDHNNYNDPNQVLGPPDAVYLGIKDEYSGMMSLGQGGYVTVDMGASAVDGPGTDVRVFQTTSSEPVTLYAATTPQGPFTLVGLRVPCGKRTGGGIFSNHCDFDLHDAGLAEARYFKVEDGEVYPCLKGGTMTEGADLDAIEILNQEPKA
jgi:hypothetical protein